MKLLFIFHQCFPESESLQYLATGRHAGVLPGEVEEPLLACVLPKIGASEEEKTILLDAWHPNILLLNNMK